MCNVLLDVFLTVRAFGQCFNGTCFTRCALGALLLYEACIVGDLRERALGRRASGAACMRGGVH